MNSKILFPVMLISALSFGAIRFDGGSAYIDFGDNNAFSFTDGAGNDRPFSVSVWVYNEANSATSGSILDKSSGVNQEYIFGFHNTNRIYAWLSDGGGTNIIGRYVSSANTYAPQNTWTHLAFTYSGGETNASVKIYVNGIQRDDTNFSGGTYTGTANTAHSLTIGRTSGGLGAGLTGQLDDLRIYNKELTLAEIQSLALSRSRLTMTDSLLLWAPLDEGTDGANVVGSGSVKDRSGSGYNGTNGNVPVWRASSAIQYP